MPRPVLIITGASSGIGAACARLAAPLYDLALGWHSNEAGMEETLAAIRSNETRAEAIRADLSTEGGVEEFFSAFDARFDRLDGFVNNAGMTATPQRVSDYTGERLRRVLDTNLYGPVLMAGAAVRRMSTAQGGPGGGIVNISSAAARLASPNHHVDYAAAKAGIDIFTRGLALETAREGIRVNAVRPGIIETPMHAKGGEPDRVALLADSVPMGRPGSAEEVAQVVLWLISAEASYVTGTVVDVTGGR